MARRAINGTNKIVSKNELAGTRKSAVLSHPEFMKVPRLVWCLRNSQNNSVLSLTVMLAKAGIQKYVDSWIPALAG